MNGDRPSRTDARIVLVAPTFPKASETFVAAKFAGLLARGHDVHVACASSPEREWDRYPQLAADPDLRRRVHVVAPHHPRWRGAVATLPTLVGLAGRTPQATRRYLTHVPSPAPRRLARLVLDAHIVGLEPDLVHFEFGSLAPERLHLAEGCGCRLTTSFRGYDLNDVGRDDPHLYDSTWPAMARIHLLGDYLWRRAQDRGCPPHAAHQLISPAVDLARFRPPTRPTEEVGTAARPLRVVMVGRTDWMKGYEHALDGLARLRRSGVEVEARICGHGPLFEAVAFARHQLGLDDVVELLGTVPASRVVDELARADVALHASVQEGFGTAVVEAQAMALPVVCTDAGGLPENVEPGVTGVVVPRRDPAAIATALGELAADAPRRTAMGAAGRRRAEQRFGMGDHLDRWEEFFAAALAVPSRR